MAFAIQTLIANGHTWSSIKSYSLSEIGVFFKTVVLMEREKQSRNLSDIWQGNNLTLEGLKGVLKELEVSPIKKKQPSESVAEVNKDWTRLAKFMSGRS